MQILTKKFWPFFIIVIVVFLTSSSGGRNGGWAGAPGDSGACTNCHGGTSDATISLTGAPSEYEAGETYALTLTIEDPAAVVGGFQIIATNGSNNTLVGDFTASTGTKLNNISRLVQSSPKSFVSGEVSWDFDWTAPATGAPSDLQFFYAGNAANNNGNTGGDEGVVGSSAIIALPVILSQWNAVPDHRNREIKLGWATATEINASYFEIMRSTDGASYESIGKIDATGNSNIASTYRFTDDEISTIDNVFFYRLKNVDLDGSFEYSTVVSARLDDKEKATLTTYPNPTSGALFIRSEGLENVSYRILSFVGKEVSIGIINNQQIDVSALPSGLFYIQFLLDGQLETMSFQKI